MGLDDQWIYNPPSLYPRVSKTVVTGYTEKEVKKIVRKAVDKTEANWKELADLQCIQKMAAFDTIQAMKQGHIPSNDIAVDRYFMQCKYKRAKAKNFDIKSAEALHQGTPEERRREEKRRGIVRKEEKKKRIVEYIKQFD